MSMRKFLLRSVAISGFALAAIGTADASPYSAVYAFGDSLSDAGNLFQLSSSPTNGIPNQPLPPYSNGRFTNGNTWVQDLSLLLGNGPLTASLAGGNDYAYGGARTGTTAVGLATFIDLPSQLAQFTVTHVSAPPSALYTLDIGANDIFGALRQIAVNTLTVTQAQDAVAAAAANAAAFATALHSLGALQLVLYDVPDLAQTPAFKAFGVLATTLTTEFNADLQTDLAAVKDAGLRVDTLGAFARQKAVLASPLAFGFTDVINPCWTGGFQGPSTGATLCDTTAAGQDSHLFWDQVHPTEAGHALVAQAALQAIAEPGALGLLVAGLAALAMVQYTRFARPLRRAKAR